MSEPEWLTVGAEVAEVTRSYGRSTGGTVAVSTIERMTPRDLVLSNGNRWRRASQRKHGDDEWSPSTELVPADDPVVSRIQRENRINKARSRALTCADDLLAAIGRQGTSDQVDKAANAALAAAFAYSDALSAGPPLT